MARAPKPYLYRGWYVTDAGGSRRKLCPEADGFERAVSLLARPPMLADVVPHYLNHCNAYYILPTGKQSDEPAKIERAFRRFLEMDPPRDLDRSHVAAFREKLIVAKLSRVYINHTVNRIAQGLRWLAEHGHIPDASAISVQLLSPLPAFRSGLPEPAKVQPVTWESVEKTLGALTQFWQSIVLVQWHTGMRPGEVCSLRADEISTDGDIWIIDKGVNHKTAYKGKKKVIPLGPNARAVLKPWLEIARLKRQTYIFRARNGGVSGHVIESSYCHAVDRACRKLRIPEWSPNQIRHAYATRLRAEAGLDAAQLMLGHSSADITQIYAEIELKRAAELAAKLG